MQKFFIAFLIFFGYKASAQTEFFHSQIKFSEKELNQFYSSISIDSAQIYFNANDYYIHAFNKKTTQLSWSYYLANKTNELPILYKKSLIVLKHFGENNDKSIQINTQKGTLINTLNISKIYNQPFIKNGMMYCTAISPKTGGAILKYDLNKNKIIWEQFVAHGVSQQAYFNKNEIVANAEANNWFKISYNGVLKDTLCLNKASLFVEDIKCIENFQVLTFDNKPITEAFLNKNLGEYDNLVFKSNEKLTAVLGNEKLLIVGENRKILHNIILGEILEDLNIGINEYKAILKIENTTIWFFYENLLVAYDFKYPKKYQAYDLAKWKPHQILLEPNNSITWLISKNDGQLVGVKLMNKTKNLKN